MSHESGRLRHRRNERGIEFERRTVRASEGEKVIEWRRMGIVEGEGEDGKRLEVSMVIGPQGCESWIRRAEANISQFKGSSMRSAAVHHGPHLLSTRSNILPTTSSLTTRIQIRALVLHFPESFLLSTTSFAAYPVTSSSLSRVSSSIHRKQEVD